MIWVIDVFRIVGAWRLEEFKTLSLGLGSWQIERQAFLVRGGKESTPDHMMCV